jgi:hypothetical protein
MRGFQPMLPASGGFALALGLPGELDEVVE